MGNSTTTLCALLATIASGSVFGQIRAIPDEGLEGLPEEAVSFTIEHHYARENNIGNAMPADPGTPPNSEDPRNFDGIWTSAKTFQVDEDGNYFQSRSPFGGGGNAPAAQAGANGGPPGAGAAPGNAPAAAPTGLGRLSCSPGDPYAMAEPTLILEGNGAMYWLHTKGRGRKFRRIEMDAELPAQVTPTSHGYSVGHWEGDTLIVETKGIEGLKAPADTVVREEIRKINGPEYVEKILMDDISDGNRTFYEQIATIEDDLMLENIVTIENKQTGEVSKQRLTAFYRPDMQYVEAPCEEYTDPFAGTYYGQPGFSGESEE